MIFRAIILGLIFVATSLWAFPIIDLSNSATDKLDPSALNKDKPAGDSFLFNQLIVMPQTVVVPIAPPPGSNPADPSAIAQGHSRFFGFQYDLNYDGNMDQFLPFKFPPYLGIAYNPEKNDILKASSKLFALPLPSFISSAEGNDNYQLFLKNISTSQNVFIMDAAAIARGEAGLFKQVQWRPGKSQLPELEAKTGQVTRVYSLSILWLGVLLGGLVLFRQWRISHRPVNR